LQEKFDLVIFDEASQCFSEKGIPAIYRARQVVITGDNQQLAPNDLYQARWEEEDEAPDLEIDSLLDLGIKYFQQVELLGHYRSQSLDLIHFSNQNFYKGRLRLLPDFRRVVENTPGIQYLKVDGLWQNNTNEVEANRIVDLVQELLEQGETDLGIVTFNFKQQNLIQDKLELFAAEKGVNLPKSLFVKNIENVQGDERDIIIFSIGYAANLKGKVGSHFGTLNMERGENRLNVAISRARKKVYVVASILPAELNVEDSKHRGPKLFKEYLEYALEVSNGRFSAEKQKEVFSELWYLKHYLKEPLSQIEGVGLSEDMPFADLTIKKGDDYKGLILTDDNRYYEAVSTKDWHAYLPMMLREKKWKFQKVYSRELWNDKSKVLKAFEKLIE
jgi:superfamily I DNA and/or RNA helicase